MNTTSDVAANGVKEPRRKRFRMPDLSVQIFIALAAGLAAGLFFGELMRVVEPVGDIFIGLLQMAVWPYIVVSLIGGLGGLSLQQAKNLGLSGVSFLLLFWLIALIAVLALVATFPSWTSAAFFSTSLSEVAGEFDFVGIYIPSNPFSSLANSVLPAVVLFSVAMGFALIPLEQEKKQPLLSLFNTLTEMFMAIASFVVRLAPLGVFALVGVAAGTMRVEEFRAFAGVYLLLHCHCPAAELLGATRVDCSAVADLVSPDNGRCEKTTDHCICDGIAARRIAARCRKRKTSPGGNGESKS